MDLHEALAIIDLGMVDTHLSNIQEDILRGSWEGSTYLEIADQFGYDPDYIREVGADLWQCLSSVFEEKVTKRNFKSVLGQHYRQSGTQQFSSKNNAASNRSQDWEDAPSIFSFLGRSQEIQTVNRWVISDACRLVGLFGMGGIGKTAIAVHVARQVQDKFDYVIWRSLQNAPPINTLLVNIIQFLSDQQDTERSLPFEISGRIHHCLQYLKQKRCLLIFDNVESILQSGQRCGLYRLGYQGYGEFFRQVGEQSHQSCLLLTSREKPQDISPLEGENLPVRSFQLSGLETDDSKNLIQLKGQFTATPSTWQQINTYYSGNPLALKIAAAAIQDLFAGNVDAFLQYSTFVFDDISDLLDQQFERLTDLETQVMYWLAIEREPVTIETLQANILQSISKRQLFESLKSLIRRSLIHKTKTGFTQQPVVMEYLVDKLRETITHEILSDTPKVLTSHALSKTQTKDYIRESQKRVFLSPISQNIRDQLDQTQDIRHKFAHLLNVLQTDTLSASGYAAGNLLSLMQTLNLEIKDLDFSGLVIRQADLRKSSLRNVNFQGATLIESEFAKLLDYYFSIAMDPRGQLLATGHSNGSITIWDFPKMERHRILYDQSYWVNKVTFSPDSQWLASVCLDQTIKIWKVPTGQCIATLSGHHGPVASASFSPDGKTLVSGGHDGLIKVWDVETWSCIKTVQEPSGAIGVVAHSPNGQIIASGSFDGHISLYNQQTFHCIRTTESHDDFIWSLVFHPNGETFFTSSYDATVKQWNTSTGDRLQTLFGHTSKIIGLACSRDGETLASGSHDQTIRLWHIATGRCLRVLQGHQSDVEGIAFSSDGVILVSTSLDRSTKLWDVNNGHVLKTVQGSASTLWSVTFSPDGTRLLSVGEDRKIYLWDVETKKLVKSWVAHTNEILCVKFHPQGNIIATSGADQQVKLWDLDSGTSLHTFYRQDWIFSIAFSPDGKMIAGGGREEVANVWDVSTGQCISSLMNTTNAFLWSVCFSNDGQYLFTSSYDATIKVWDTQTWELCLSLTGHKSFINSLSYCPSKDLLVSGGHDGAIKLWNVKRGECRKTLEGHTGDVFSVCFSPDGTLVASAGFDNVIKLWDVETGECLHTLTGHQGFILSTNFHPVQDMVASCGLDGSIRLWNTISGECLNVLHPPKLYEGMNISDIKGLSASEKEMLIALGATEKS